MSFENRNGTTPPPVPPLYTVYPVGNQGSINYGFQGFRPEDPPPKYEDVITGDVLKSNYSSYNFPSTPTAESTYQSVNMNAPCTCSRVHTAHLEHSSFEENEKNSCGAACTAFIVFIIFALIILRVTLLLQG